MKLGAELRAKREGTVDAAGAQTRYADKSSAQSDQAPSGMAQRNSWRLNDPLMPGFDLFPYAADHWSGRGGGLRWRTSSSHTPAKANSPVSAASQED